MPRGQLRTTVLVGIVIGLPLIIAGAVLFVRALQDATAQRSPTTRRQRSPHDIHAWLEGVDDRPWQRVVVSIVA